MARGRQLSTYIDEDGEGKLRSIGDSIGWDNSDSKLVLKLLDFAMSNLDDWVEFNKSGISTKDRDANIYKVLALISQGKVFPDGDAVRVFIEGGVS